MSFGRGVEWGFTCGLYLLWMKEKMLKHGEYESWVNDNCPFDIRQAQRYTRLVKKWDEIQAKATSEDAFPSNSVAGLLEYVKEEAQPAASEEEPAEPSQEAATEEAPPTADTGDDGDTEAEVEQDETAEVPPASLPFPSGASTTTSGNASKRKTAPRPKPEHQNWRLPKTAKFRKIERVGNELFHALWVDGKKSYGLLLSIEQAAQFTCGLTNEFDLVAEMEEAKANELE